MNTALNMNHFARPTSDPSASSGGADRRPTTVPLPSSVHVADEAPPLRVLASGVAALDAVLPGGGLPLGRLTEIQGPAMGGKLSLAQEFLLRTLEAGRRAAYIDLTGTFYPAGFPDAAHLLVARPQDWKQALRSADILTASGEWGFVAVDLSGHAHALAAEVCTRLARSARTRDTAVVLLHDHPVRTLGSLISLRLKVCRKLRPEGRTLEVLVAKNKLSSPGRIVSLPLYPVEEA
jgi:hypothetical protein